MGVIAILYMDRADLDGLRFKCWFFRVLHTLESLNTLTWNHAYKSKWSKQTCLLVVTLQYCLDGLFSLQTQHASFLSDNVALQIWNFLMMDKATIFKVWLSWFQGHQIQQDFLILSSTSSALSCPLEHDYEGHSESFGTRSVNFEGCLRDLNFNLFPTK